MVFFNKKVKYKILMKLFKRGFWFKILFYFLTNYFVLFSYSQVNMGTNFRIVTGLPVDSRMVVNDLTARDTIHPYFRYEGLIVYVISTQINYQLVGGITNLNWSAIVSSKWNSSGADLYFNTGNIGIATSNPATALSVGPGSELQVNSSGNIIKINNVTTSFPSSQGSAKSYLINDGSGNMSWTATPEGANFKITPEGGYAVKLKNKSGVTVNKGTVVQASGTDSASFVLAVVSSENPIGIVYDNSIADGNDCWVVVSGIADIYFEASVSYGAWAGTSDTNPGEAQTTFAIGIHDQEIGHAISTRTGAGLARAIIHFR
jgi:hypothetical protein